MADFAAICGDTISQARIFNYCHIHTPVSDFCDEWKGCIQKTISSGACNQTGHVRHTVMDDAFFYKCWMLVRGWAGCFDTPPLIDADIHDDRAWLHRAHHLASDHMWWVLANDQHRADSNIRVAHRAGDIVGSSH